VLGAALITLLLLLLPLLLTGSHGNLALEASPS
jgi:hypothetical protein